jgi:ribosome-interacting GTPase 1
MVMPVNAPVEYFKAEERFKSAKTREERILAMEEMIRLLPRHHGSETALAQLKSRLAKLKKTAPSKGGAHKEGIKKEGDAQIAVVGLTNSGKSWLLSKLTKAQPTVSANAYTTTRPFVGTMDYNGIKLQLVEIPSTFLPEYMSIARNSDAIVIAYRNEVDKEHMKEIMEAHYIRQKNVFVNPWKDDIQDIRKNIWKLLGLIIIYAKKSGSPMALKTNSTVKDFTERIHKDFIKNFRFARIVRGDKLIQAGLNYRLIDGDVVEIHA